MRKEKQYHFIYKTTNLLNGKFYIGMHSSNDFNDGYFGSGLRLRRSIKKYGEENFNIEYLEFYSTRDALIQREVELVNEDILKDPLCMNLVVGGSGWDSKLAIVNSKKGQAVCRKKWKEDKNWAEVLRKKHSDWLIQAHKIGKVNSKNNKYFLNHQHTQETITKIKESIQGQQIGNKNSQFGTCWITNGKENKKIKKQDLIPENWKLGRLNNWSNR